MLSGRLTRLENVLLRACLYQRQWQEADGEDDEHDHQLDEAESGVVTFDAFLVVRVPNHDSPIHLVAG